MSWLCVRRREGEEKRKEYRKKEKEEVKWGGKERVFFILIRG